MQALPLSFPSPSMRNSPHFAHETSAITSPFLQSEAAPRDLELLVKKCEASLQRLSDFTALATKGGIDSTNGYACPHQRHEVKASSNNNNKPIIKYYEDTKQNSNLTTVRDMDLSKKDEIVTVTVTELTGTDSNKPTTKSRKSKASAGDNNGRKFKVSKPKSRPSLSRTTSGSATTSSSIDSCDSSQEAIDVEEAGVISPPFMPSPGIPMDGAPPTDYFTAQPKHPQPNSLLTPDASPSDSNVCNLLRTGIATCNVALTESCLSYLRKRAVFHPLIAIRACAPFACPHPSFPASVIPYIRPILQEAIRTLLDDFPEYESGEACTQWSAYVDSVPPVLQELFSHEWCRYVRRIKSFHENSPFDDFDYDHSDDCLGGRHACEARTREVVRDAWNAFWKESILSGNRCVPRPSQVAKFFCTYGDDDSEEERTTAPNSRCRAGFKEELIQTLECIGGVNAKWNWRFLGGDRFMDVFGGQ